MFSSPCSHLGVAKPVLPPIYIDGVQKLLGGIFTVNKLPFWDGAGIEEPVPGEGGRRPVPGLLAVAAGLNHLKGKGC